MEREAHIHMHLLAYTGLFFWRSTPTSYTLGEFLNNCSHLLLSKIKLVNVSKLPTYIENPTLLLNTP